MEKLKLYCTTNIAIQYVKILELDNTVGRFEPFRSDMLRRIKNLKQFRISDLHEKINDPCLVLLCIYTIYMKTRGTTTTQSRIMEIWNRG